MLTPFAPVGVDETREPNAVAAAHALGSDGYLTLIAWANASCRPSYSGELFDYLACVAPDHERAWDCGTGNGQAAIALAERFASVEATDASPNQIKMAVPHDRVRYRVASAEESRLASYSVDLAVVAQAVHWFDLDRSTTEVRRVLRPKGVLAVWCYRTPRTDSVVDDRQAPRDSFAFHH